MPDIFTPETKRQATGHKMTLGEWAELASHLSGRLSDARMHVEATDALDIANALKDARDEIAKLRSKLGVTVKALRRIGELCDCRETLVTYFELVRDIKTCATTAIAQWVKR